MAKQEIPNGPHLNVGNEFWVLWLSGKKLKSEKLGPKIITRYEPATKRYTVTDGHGNTQARHMDQFRVCLAQEHQREARVALEAGFLTNYGAILPKSSLVPIPIEDSIGLV